MQEQKQETAAVNLNLPVRVWKDYQKLMIEQGTSASKVIAEFMKKEVDGYGLLQGKSESSQDD